MNKVKVKIPATVANIGSGFDCMGVAIKIYNEIEVEVTEKEGSILILGEGQKELKRNRENIIIKAMRRVFSRTGYKNKNRNFKIISKNNIPIERGLGSSASAIVGGVIAGNLFSGEKIDNGELLNISVEIEGHPDNIIPAFFGGLCVSYSVNHNIRYVKIEMPSELKAVLCIPDFRVKTSIARKILPRNVPIRDAVYNSSRTALMVYSILRRDYRLLAESMKDKLHQDYRKKLIPGMEDVIKSALEEGALGCALSGSGPTIFAISKGDKKMAEKIGTGMSKVFEKRNIKNRIVITEFDNGGIKISK